MVREMTSGRRARRMFGAIGTCLGFLRRRNSAVWSEA